MSGGNGKRIPLVTERETDSRPAPLRQNMKEVHSMSSTELGSKIRELLQLQSLIDEAKAEAEAIRDAIKAHMGSQEVLRAGEYTVLEAHKVRKNRRCGPESGPSRCGRPVHSGSHHPPFLCGIKRSPARASPAGG